MLFCLVQMGNGRRKSPSEQVDTTHARSHCRMNAGAQFYYVYVVPVINYELSLDRARLSKRPTKNILPNFDDFQGESRHSKTASGVNVVVGGVVFVLKLRC